MATQNGCTSNQLAKREKVARNKISDYKKDSRRYQKDSICGNGTKKEGNTYSGERQLLGVATMHKPNMAIITCRQKRRRKRYCTNEEKLMSENYCTTKGLDGLF